MPQIPKKKTLKTRNKCRRENIHLKLQYSSRPLGGSTTVFSIFSIALITTIGVKTWRNLSILHVILLSNQIVRPYIILHQLICMFSKQDVILCNCAMFCFPRTTWKIHSCCSLKQLWWINHPFIGVSKILYRLKFGFKELLEGIKYEYTLELVPEVVWKSGKVLVSVCLVPWKVHLNLCSRAVFPLMLLNTDLYCNYMSRQTEDLLRTCANVFIVNVSPSVIVMKACLDSFIIQGEGFTLD